MNLVLFVETTSLKGRSTAPNADLPFFPEPAERVFCVAQAQGKRTAKKLHLQNPSLAGWQNGAGSEIESLICTGV